MKIAIRVDGNKKLGMGNVYRSLVLAKKMMENHHEVVFISKMSTEIINTVKKHSFSIFLINQNLSKEDLTVQVKHIVQENNIEMLINDVKNTDMNYMKNLKLLGIKTVNFDDLGYGRDFADILFDAFMHKNNTRNSKENYGPEFLILRDEFKILNNTDRSNKSVHSIAVIMGATNAGNFFHKVIKALINISPEIECHFIFSKSFQDAELFQMDYSQKNFFFHYNPIDISNIFANCDLAITAGGISMCEACALGTPTLVIPQVPHEEKNAFMFQNDGAVSAFCYDPNITEKDIFERVNFIINNKRFRNSLAKKSREYIDGRGVDRIMDILNPHLN